ncbi:uncharacterized protein SCHCODRAFT_01087865 [Schizophyllum commune H4-8]|nr:uncharacterized protein SCHCODRAFT_01087865 [Schizophyllum commune H4-8]KAI5894461.1 hypothetical protein SCHCODRAFT_01087865 [Schizophyllum commune H4-8]
MSVQRAASLFHRFNHQTARFATIIFIPDPRLSESVNDHDDTSTYLYEMTCWIDPQALSRISLAAPRCAYLPEALLTKSAGRDDINLSIDVVDYPDFVTAVTLHSPDDEMWRRLLRADAIIGGPALNENYMHPAYMIHLDAYIAGVSLLEQRVFLWPCAKSLWCGGNKTTLAAELQFIATHITHTPRPAERGIQGPPGPPKMGWVQKRGYSARAEHVLLPSEMEIGGVPKSLDEPAPPEARWIEQAYIDTLRDTRFGELRCFIVSGEVTRIIRTVPSGDGMTCNGVDDGWPSLAQHWRIYHGMPPSPTQQRQGILELTSFVLDTYKALVGREKAALAIRDSDLEVVCRMDIGLLMDDVAAHYFVLEVERGLTLCMFSHHDVEGASQDIEAVATCILSHI